MRLDLSRYAQTYDDNNYNCLHFAVDVYRDLTGNDMTKQVSGLLTGKKQRHVDIEKLKQFKLLDAPTDPCLAVMHSEVLHVGIYHKSKIIHITESGIQNIATHFAEIRHGRIKYYAI